MKWRIRGSYTVEGSIIISFICFIIGSVVLMGFFCHDRTVIQSVTDELAMYGSLWSGKYVNPQSKEVDYEALKNNGDTTLAVIESKGYQLLEGKLFCGRLRDIQVNSNLFGKEVQVMIRADFEIGFLKIPCVVKAHAEIIRSNDLPRRVKEEVTEDEPEVS